MSVATGPSPLSAWSRARTRDAAGAAALWLVILAFGLWAVIAHTDEFVVGVVVGSVFALGAIGLTLIYGVLKFGHFAHGDAMMLSAYVAFLMLSGRFVGSRADITAPLRLDRLPGARDPIWEFSFGYGLLLAIPLAAIIAVLLFLALDARVYRPLRERKAGVVILAIASLGTAIAMRSILLMVWGPQQRFYAPGIRHTTELPLLGTRVVNDQFFIVAAAFAVVAAVYVILFRTTIGRAMRAMADNADLARVAGIDTDAVVRWTWVVAGTLITIAGVLLALQAQLKPELGFTILLPLFAATVLGGIGSPQGALAGGLIVGITQEVAVTFDVLGPGYKFSVAFVILMLVVLLRPRGLFGASA